MCIMEVCKRCKTKFEPKPKYKNFCSDKCKFPYVWTDEEKAAIRQRTLNQMRSVGRIPIEDRHYACNHCNKEYRPKYLPSTFCSRTCASKHRFLDAEKRSRHGMAVKASMFAKRGNLPTKKNQLKLCSSCGDAAFKGIYCTGCKKFALNGPLFNKLGIDEAITLKERGELAKKKLMELYCEEEWSMLDIQRVFKVNLNTLHKFAKKSGFKIRSVSEGNYMAIRKGKPIPNATSFKQGWHTTWEGRRFYYRSSYEFDVCNELDEKKVSYSIESLRIQYYDSQKQKIRTALPDFHLPVHNEIVEVKSEYFFDKVNMQDKFKEYKSRGYDCRLLLEHKKYSYEEVLAM